LDKLKERGLLSEDAFEKRKEAAVDMFIEDMSRLASEALEVQAVKPKRRGNKRQRRDTRLSSASGSSIQSTSGEDDDKKSKKVSGVERSVEDKEMQLIENVCNNVATPLFFHQQ